MQATKRFYRIFLSRNDSPDVLLVSTIYLATNSTHPLLTADDQLALRVLEQRGHVVRPLVWSSCTPRDIPAGSAIIMRSVWDYHLRKSEFTGWLFELTACALKVHNCVPLLEWNLDKRYLKNLDASGAEVIPTVWIDKSSEATLTDVMREAGWERIVIKPTVSASAYMTMRVNGFAEARALEDCFRSVRSREVMMVQPYIEEIATEGEWSLIFLGGKFSHAVLKTPAKGDFRVQVDFGGSVVPATPPEHVLRAGMAVVTAFPFAPLYARIDGIEVSGRLLLMEAECIDPVLHFSFDAYAAYAFAHALEQLLTHEPTTGEQQDAYAAHTARSRVAGCG